MVETCFVGCTPGLEAALRDELEGLGVRATVTSGGCEVTGPSQSFVRLNVQSRLASRVLLRLGHARTPAALASVPLRSVVGDAELALNVTTSGKVTPPPEVWRREAAQRWRVQPRSASASLDGQRSTQGTSADGAGGRAHEGSTDSRTPRARRDDPRGSQRRVDGRTPGAADLDRQPQRTPGTGGPSDGGRGDDGPVDAGDSPLEVSLRLDAGGAVVSVDTSGELLHVRGARQETGKAPLRETLASGVLRLCEWSPGEPLWDVMCGSGTFLLEAAEHALGLQPGRNRHFAFERFVSVSAEALAQATAPRAPVGTWLRGSDVNAGALGVA
nr:hypothetical protein [Myxococcaceae bacterium]